MPWLLLLAAIVAEVVATSLLKSTAGFTRLGPSVVVVLGYGVAFVLLSRCLTRIPVGVVYAVWSGLGVALITFVPSSQMSRFDPTLCTSTVCQFVSAVAMTVRSTFEPHTSTPTRSPFSGR